VQAASQEAKTATSSEDAKNLKHQIQSCSQCDSVPCEKLAHLDKRYRERYGMSMVENVKIIKAKGMNEFLKSQAEKYSCPSCSKGVVCVHDNKCYTCGYTSKP
jgi:ribosomal protein S27AE